MTYNINGKKVYAQNINGSLWLHVDGKTYQHTEVNMASSSGGAELDPSKICAPMPGKIIKVSCKDNGKVNKGDVLVIMEAMKMEYKLTAGMSGAVNLKCKEGDIVSLGQELVIFEVPN